MVFTSQNYFRGSADAWVTWGPTKPYNLTYVKGECFASPPFPVAGDMPGSGSIESCKKLASQKLMLQGRKAQQSLQSLVALGEFGETVRLLRNPAKALFSGIRNYMKDARRRASRVKKKHRDRVVQDTWLEYQFGWRPLVSDIEGAYNALHNMPQSRYKKVHASHSIAGSAIITFGNTVVGELSFDWENRKLQDTSCRAYGEVVVECLTPRGSLARWGVSTSEFLPTLWELIPYSFVADYFSNIGDAIAAATYPISNFAWHGMTTRNRVSAIRLYRFNRSDTMNNQGQSKDADGFCSSAGANRVVYERNTAIYTGSQVFKLTFEIPGLGLKWLNLAALKK
jgi:hypothetical protein